MLMEKMITIQNAHEKICSYTKCAYTKYSNVFYFEAFQNQIRSKTNILTRKVENSLKRMVTNIYTYPSTV